MDWNRFWGVLLGAVLLCSTSCQNDLETVADFETLGGPSQVLQGAALEYSDDGQLTHRLNAQHMSRSSEDPPIWEVTDGFTLEVIDDTGGVEALLGAQRGSFAEETRYLEARGGVVLRGANQDTLLTELLYWSADSDRVHTTAPVEVRTPEGTLYGRGLESDARFQRYSILEPTGTFLVDTTTSTP
ncbi:MAG: LPS export ABC transporter periplasmic protein LptC [Flavobacteriales bacterium]|nr:LPS export ABC transporter periplasmic protein LptC [Flavobacteriales bacterium]